MSDVWEDAWDSINDVFQRVAEDLKQRNVQLWWTCGHSENEAFPFWAYAAFSRAGVAGEEDLVISASFKRVNKALEFTSDIARGDGEIVADGPTSTIELATDTASLQHWIAMSVDQLSTFILEHTATLRQELS